MKQKWLYLTFTALMASFTAATVLANPPEPGKVDSFNAQKDTYLNGNNQNDKNFGAASTLKISKKDKQTTVLSFDLDQINRQGGFGDDCNLTKDLYDAKLIFKVANANNCKDGGCELEIRTTDNFTEGNGDNSGNGSGQGATWHCSTDSNISNNQKECTGDSNGSWSGGSNGSFVQKVNIANSNTEQEVSVSIKNHLISLNRGSLKINLLVSNKDSQGSVTIKSRESGNAPRVELTQPKMYDTEAEVSGLTRGLASVLGPDNIHTIQVSYSEMGDPASPNVFLLVAGQPASSYMYRNMIPKLAERGYVVALDWIGMRNGTKVPFEQFTVDPNSPNPSSPEIKFFYDQATMVERFVNAKGLTQNGRKIILIAHEVGTLASLQYAVTHQENIKGIAFSESWLDYCPDDQAAQGICSHTTIIPPPYFPAFAGFVYPDSRYNPAFAGFFPPGTPTPYPYVNRWTGACSILRGGSTAQSLKYNITSRGISDTVVANYQAEYGCQFNPDYNPTDPASPVCLNDPLCDLDFSTSFFPMDIPAEDIPGSPSNANLLYANYLQILKAVDNPNTTAREDFNIPRVMLYGDRSTLITNFAQVSYVGQNYPHTSLMCVGPASHLAPEDQPYNTARTVIDWAEENNLLN